ncbi:MAG: SMP-30/gluconolactonase/LRE family protein [Rhodothermales bacterium]
MRPPLLSYLTLFATALFTVGLAACDEILGDSDSPIRAFPAEYQLPGDQVFPEGIAYDDSDEVFYVSATNNGTIFSADVHGDTVEVFSAGGADGRTTARGMDVRGDRLFIAGGPIGTAYAYDTDDGELIASFTTPAPPADGGTFINDVTITPNGDAYFTDSFRPILFRAASTDTTALEPWLDLTGTPIQYGDGFNLNGIVSTPGGRYLIVVQSNTGQLFRISTDDDPEVQAIDLGGATLTNGDGLLLDGQILYAVRNQQGLIVPVELSDDFLSGTAGEGFTSDALMFPTTIAQISPRSLLVVNAQFDEQGPNGSPSLPFNVVRIQIPR